MEVCGSPYEFRVGVTFGVVFNNPIEWSETNTVSDKEEWQLIPHTGPVCAQPSGRPTGQYIRIG